MDFKNNIKPRQVTNFIVLTLHYLYIMDNKHYSFLSYNVIWFIRDQTAGYKKVKRVIPIKVILSTMHSVLNWFHNFSVHIK